MPRTNYSCVQLPNISVDIAKCGAIFHKFIQYTHFCRLQKWPVLMEQSIHGRCFNSWWCPLMRRTNYKCVQSPNISVDIAKCGESFHKFKKYAHSWSVTKNDLSWMNYLFMVMFQLIKMSSYATNKLQMCSVMTQHQCRQLPNEWKLFTHTFGDVYTDVGWLNTFVVCSSHKRTSSWVEALPWIDCSSQDRSFFVTDKSECTGWICEKLPHIWRCLHWCWVTEHNCSLFLA